MTTDRRGVLIVDDEVLIADYLQMLVEDEGLEGVGVAGCPLEAIEIAEANPPSIALVDLNLVESGDGLALASELRHRFGARIILLSGTAEPQTSLRHVEIDTIGFLQKPFLPAELARLLEGALAEAA